MPTLPRRTLQVAVYLSMLLLTGCIVFTCRI